MDVKLWRKLPFKIVKQILSFSYMPSFCLFSLFGRIGTHLFVILNLLRFILDVQRKMMHASYAQAVLMLVIFKASLFYHPFGKLMVINNIGYNYKVFVVSTFKDYNV